MPLFLWFVGFIGGYLLAFIYNDVLGWFFQGKALVLFGYKLHHSLYGLLFFLLEFIPSSNVPLSSIELNKLGFFLFVGLGIIIQHGLTDGFVFVTKAE